jgi:deazaflavin-dependent oxidoreductase (nitroreductase family)
MFTRFYFAVEYFILCRVPRDRPQGIFRLLFRVPVWLYRAGFGFTLGKGVLLLSVIGRRSGKRRITALGFGRDPVTGAYVVAAGWTHGADWYCNALAHPQVQIWLGRRWIDCRAQPLPNDASVEQYRTLSAINPYAGRIFSQWLGRPFAPTIDDFQEVARLFPSLSLIPVRDSLEGA